MPEFFKLNFDGGFRGNLGKSGLGACIRDCIGKVLAITMAPLPIGTKNMVEAQSLLSGLILAKKVNFHQVQIEGDPQVIISACVKRQSSSWKLKYVLQQIWNITN